MCYGRVDSRSERERGVKRKRNERKPQLTDDMNTQDPIILSFSYEFNHSFRFVVRLRSRVGDEEEFTDQHSKRVKIITKRWGGCEDRITE